MGRILRTLNWFYLRRFEALGFAILIGSLTYLAATRVPGGIE